MTKLTEFGCDLCHPEMQIVLWRDAFCRVVKVPSDEYPGFYRVILNRHVREMTDLPQHERARRMGVV